MSHSQVASAAYAGTGSQRAAVAVRVVGLWRRGLAALVDLMVVAPAVGLASLAGGWALGIPARPFRTLRPETLLDLAVSGDPRLVGLALLATFVALLYGATFIALLGATPGMRLLGCRVITPYGDRPGPGRAVARGLAFMAALAPLGLGLLWIGFDREKRGLHDWIAGTLVIARRGARGGQP